MNVIYDKTTQKVYGGGDLEEYEKLGVQDDLYGCPGIRSDYFPKGVIGNTLCTFRHAYEFIRMEKANTPLPIPGTKLIGKWLIIWRKMTIRLL